jgi:hypothetical protein
MWANNLGGSTTFFNKSTGLVEVSCDIVLDDTNGSEVSKLILMS